MSTLKYSIAAQLGPDRYARLLEIAAERGFTADTLEQTARESAARFGGAEPVLTARATARALQLAGLAGTSERALIEIAKLGDAAYAAALAERHNPPAPVATPATTDAE